MIIWFTPNQSNNLTKWMFFQKLFLKSSLLLHNRQVRHSSTFPKQQGRPLPSLPSVFSSLTAPKDRRRVALSGSPLSCSIRALTTAVVLYRELDHSRTRHRNPASMYKLAGKKGRHRYLSCSNTNEPGACAGFF